MCRCPIPFVWGNVFVSCFCGFSSRMGHLGRSLSGRRRMPLRSTHVHRCVLHLRGPGAFLTSSYLYEILACGDRIDMKLAKKSKSETIVYFLTPSCSVLSSAKRGLEGNGHLFISYQSRTSTLLCSSGRRERGMRIE